MNWASARKRLYLPVLLAAVAVAISIYLALPPHLRVQGGVIIALACLLPGFIGRMLLSDLLASRAFLARGEHQSGLLAARRFLATLDAMPWIRHAIWTQYGTYTLDVRAMALNNKGAALLEMKHVAEAERALNAARKCDSNYPIPVFNLAVIAKLEGDERRCEVLAREAARLGFAGGQLDRTIMSIGESYARLATPG